MAVCSGSRGAPTFSRRGFTLIELAIVMFIVSLLVGGMLLPLSAQQDIKSLRDTTRALETARDALLGFAVINERLPCPATANSSGRETFCSNQTYPCTGAEEYSYDTPTNNGICFDYYGAFLPSVTLGLQPIDNNGFALDDWGSNPANRLRYSVSTNSLRNYSSLNPPVIPTPFVVTQRQGLKSAVVKPDLAVCNAGAQVINPGTSTAETAVGQNFYARCSVGNALVEDAVAIVYSLGKTAGLRGAGADETHNPNPFATVAPDPAFVGAPAGTAFDDSLLWITGNSLMNRLATANKL
jgi:prepilin-type N-terminal cleavage/methylation domain-containing protein